MIKDFWTEDELNWDEVDEKLVQEEK